MADETNSQTGANAGETTTATNPTTDQPAKSKPGPKPRLAVVEQTGAQDNDAEQKAPKVKLVRMVRDKNEHPAPHSADVHPEEMANFEAGGWVKA